MAKVLLSLGLMAFAAVSVFVLFDSRQCAATSTGVVQPIAALDEVADPAPLIPAQIQESPAIGEPEPVQLAADEAPSFLAVEPAAPNPPPATQQLITRTIKVPRTKTVYEDQVVEVAEVTPLQQQYSVLMLKRAQRMTEEELKAAIEEVEAELQQQDEQADAELQKAIEILNQLQEDASGTPAARHAAGALPVLRGSQTSDEAPDVIPSGTVPFYDSSGASFEQPAQPLSPVPTY